MSAKPIDEMTSAELDAGFARLLHRLSDDQLEELERRLRDLVTKGGKSEEEAA